MLNFSALTEVYERFPFETMPFITGSIERLKKEQPYKGLKIVHNLHITFSAICKIVPLMYSGAEVVATVTDDLQIDPVALEILQNANINFILPENLPDDFDIALDCGGRLSNYLTPRIGAAELTQSGKEKYLSKELTYPVISVDESHLKNLETLLGTGDGFVRALIELTEKNIQNKKFVLIGYGKVGRGIVRALLPYTNSITIVELDNKKIQLARENGLEAISIIDDRDEVIKRLNEAFCAITATGVEGAMSEYFTQKDFGNCKYLANMGTENEFGSAFKIETILCKGAPINFSIKVPTLHKYLDPVFFAHNSVIDLLLSKKFSKGFHKLPRVFDDAVIKKWIKIHKEPVEEIVNFE